MVARSPSVSSADAGTHLSPPLSPHIIPSTAQRSRRISPPSNPFPLRWGKARARPELAEGMGGAPDSPVVTTSPCHKPTTPVILPAMKQMLAYCEGTPRDAPTTSSAPSNPLPVSSRMRGPISRSHRRGGSRTARLPEPPLALTPSFPPQKKTNPAQTNNPGSCPRVCGDPSFSPTQTTLRFHHRKKTTPPFRVLANAGTHLPVAP